jgi:hypothetical protein
VYADSDAACARGEIISTQSALTAFVEFALGIERERGGWDDETAIKCSTSFGVHINLVGADVRRL